MLRVTAPRVPPVGVFIARLQADQQPVDRAGVNIAFRERGLERHRLFQRISEGQRAVLLLDCDYVPLRAAHVQIALAERGRTDVSELSPGDVVRLHLWTTNHDYAVLYSFDEQPRSVDPRLPAGEWQVRFDSADARWNGPREQPLPESQRLGDGNTLPLPPHSFIVLTRNRPPDWPDWA